MYSEVVRNQSTVIVYENTHAYVTHHMIKVTKNNKSFFVNSYEGSFIDKIFRASVNFYLSYLNDSFWKNFEEGKWERETFVIFDKFIDDHHSFIDIGAWKGPTTLYGSVKAKHVYAVEPDPVAFGVLKSNIGLNPDLKRKITLYHGAISDKTGPKNISSRFGFGDSMSSTIEDYTSNSVSVASLSFNDFIKKFRIKNCNFIKIDTEGAETNILPSMNDFMKKYKPTIHLSLHPVHFRHLDEDTHTIVRIITMYRHIYTSKGKIINSSTVAKKLLQKIKFDIVITDRNWS